MGKKILVYLLAFLMLFNIIPVSVYADSASECSHDYSHARKYTVTETVFDGYGTGGIVYCGDCGVVLHTDSWNGNAFTDGQVSFDLDTGLVTFSDPDQGTRSFYIDSGVEYTGSGDSHVHAFTTKVSTVPSTCEVAGYEVWECECGLTTNIPLPLADHTEPADSTTTATCTSDGVRTYICSVCHNAINVEEAALGHDYGTPVKVAPTCTAQGYTVVVCSRCNAEVRSDYLPMIPHAWVSDGVTEPADCTHDGKIHYHCANCTAQKDETIPATTKHEYQKTDHKDATCDEDGYDLFECVNCDASYKVTIDHGHDWGSPEDIIYVAPTCGEDGSVTYQCKNCHTTYSEPIPATGEHDWVLISDTATCMAGGVKSYECSVCHSTKTESSPALGHAWGEWSAVTPADCENDGSEKRTCERGCVETRPIPALGHHYVNYVCTNCGDTYPDVQALLDAIDALPESTDITAQNAAQTLVTALSVRDTADALLADPASPEADALTHLGASRLQKLDAVITACQFYELHSVSIPTFGMQRFIIEWNDNNVTANRTPADQFLEASGAALSYEIVTVSDPHVVATGSLRSREDVLTVFGFLKDFSYPEDEPLLLIEEDGEYTVSTNAKLPVSFVTTTTNFATMDTSSVSYRINYKLTFNNPVPDTYVLTLPENAGETAVLKNGEAAILTELIDWNARLYWRDDNNRSAYGGTSSSATPRPSLDNVKNSITVMYYPLSHNTASGYPVTRAYDLDLEMTGISNGTIHLGGLPAYDNEGNPISYYLVPSPFEAANTDVVPGNRYTWGYNNRGNYASKSNGIYDDGALFEILDNTLEFKVTKVWDDNLTPSERPNAQFHIWRITEQYVGDTLNIDPYSAYVIPDTADSYPVPKADSETFVFARSFPMYDINGARYIYFGSEIGVSGEYKTEIDRSTSATLPDVIDRFDDSYPRYFLNGSTITNTLLSLQDLKPLPLKKTFAALALQSKLSAAAPISATFLLQMKDGSGNWVPADVRTAPCTLDGLSYTDESATVEVDENGHLHVTLTDFNSDGFVTDLDGNVTERIGCTYRGLGVSARATTEYRYVETGVSINGVSATYDPSLWTEQPDGTLIYDGPIIVYDGQTSKVLGDPVTKTSGPDDSTALFYALGDGYSFSNHLYGSHQIDIKKYWYGENGQPIAGDAERLGNAEVTFQVYRDDAPYELVTLTIEDLVMGQDYWEKLLEYDRYDEEGREYRYKVEEVSVDGDGGIHWVRTEEYKVGVVEFPPESGILVKRTDVEYVNAVGTGHVLEFEVEKEWYDNSDLENRHPVEATLFRIKDAKGNYLSAPLEVGSVILSQGNNWFRKINVAAADEEDLNGNTIADVVSNYVIIEKGMVVGNHTVMNTDYPLNMTCEELDQLRESICGTDPAFVGYIGSSQATGESWDGLQYVYIAKEHCGPAKTSPSDSHILYTLSNYRWGLENFSVMKKWKTGGIFGSAKFGISSGSSDVCDFVLHVDENGSASITDINWYIDSDAVISVVSDNPSGTFDSNGNYSIGFQVEGLNKYDENGVHIAYVIQELGVYDASDAFSAFSNSIAKLDGRSISTSQYSYCDAASELQHHTPDVYVVEFTNSVFGSYTTLTSNKVWRDDQTQSRPDVSFSVYQMSLSNPQLRALVETGTPAALSAFLSQYTDADHLILADRIWDSHINEYWWTCSIDSLPQYDENGYPYVYYAKETLGGESDYVGYYCNKTCETAGYRPALAAAPYATKDIFGIENSELETASGHVFILADGVHTDDSGSYNGYYSATAVNRPEKELDVSGEKLWKLPLGWIIPDEYFPDVTVDLYRSNQEIAFTDYNSVDAYVDAVKEIAEKAVFSDGIVASQTVDHSSGYAYRFEKDRNETLLPKYDRWGTTYYYYTLEHVSDFAQFPQSRIVYNDNDFSIANVFSSTPPSVQITVEKTWEVSQDILDHLAEYGFTGLDTEDLAPAAITLNGTSLDRNGAEITGSGVAFATAVLEPKAMSGDYTIQNASEGNPDNRYHITVTGTGAAKTITATYTFTSFYNDQTEAYEPLTYYWIKNYRISYDVSEEDVNGFEQVYDSDPIELAQVSDQLYANTDDQNAGIFLIANTYLGGRTAFSFKKIWDDGYVDNADYRPASVTFTIKRKTGDQIDPDFSTTATLEKSSFGNNETWTGTVDNLVKYSPQGKLYTYFLYSETIGDITVTIDSENKEIGNYELTTHTSDTFVNTLKQEVSITVRGNKSWTLNDGTISDYTNDQKTGFDDLRKLGVLPKSVLFILERSSDGSNWSTVASPDTTADNVHTVSYGSNIVVGRLVDLTQATQSNFSAYLNPIMTWKKLPKYDPDRMTPYYYRMTEVLEWWTGEPEVIADPNVSGGVPAAYTANTRSGSASFSVSSADGAFNIQNDLGAKKVRIAKNWVDANGAQNTRPTTMTVTVTPANTEGMVFTLAANGNPTGNTDANIYYSDSFYLPFELALIFGQESGNTLTITESYQTREGVSYTEQIQSSAETVTFADQMYTLTLINTRIAPADQIDLTAQKVWKNDSDWADLVRPQLEFTIAYKDRTTGDFVELTDTTIQQFSLTETQATKSVPSDGKVTWKMHKYWPSVSVDGIAEPIQYRVTEKLSGTVVNSSYTDAGPVSFAADQTSAASSKEYQNTLKTFPVKVQKTWTKNGSAAETFTKSEIQKLIDLNAIPKYVYVVLEYYTGSEWTEIPVTNYTKKFGSDALMGESDLGVRVPQFDKNGNVIQYRVRETSVEYKNGTTKQFDLTYTGNTAVCGSITATISANSIEAGTSPNSLKFSLVNDYKYTSLTLTKHWIDEFNRDGTRNDFGITLKRDGEAYHTNNTGSAADNANTFFTVTNPDETWTLKWDYLPYYKQGTEPSEANQSVYTWEETTVPDPYGVKVVSDTEFRNIAQPKRGSIEASKEFRGDYQNAQGIRPTEVYFKLQYKNDARAWIDVTKATLAGFGVDGKTVYVDDEGDPLPGNAPYTTSADSWITVNSSTGWKAVWSDLPVNRLNNSGTPVAVEYRVIEGYVSDGTVVPTTSAYPYTVTNATNLRLSADVKKEAVIRNDQKTKNVYLEKQFIGDSAYKSLVRPSKITFLFEYRVSGTSDWLPVPAACSNQILSSGGKSYVVLNSGDLVTGTTNTYRKCLDALPESNGYGKEIEYRFTEVSISYADPEITVDVSSNSGTFYAGPYKITNVTVPVSDATMNSQAVKKAVFQNTLVTDSIRAAKDWEDASNRDSSREAVRVQLYRKAYDPATSTVDQAIGEPVELNATNGWTYTWSSLPVFCNDSDSLSTCTYYVREVGESSGKYATKSGTFVHDVSYDQASASTIADGGSVSISNTYQPRLMSLSAVKDWGSDFDGKIRPDSITFRLQYRISGTSSWIDFNASNVLADMDALMESDPDKVYVITSSTSSNPCDITVNAASNWTANWSGLTAFVLQGGSSKAVEFRVKELPTVPNYTAQNSGYTGAVSYNSTNKNLTVKNDLVLSSLQIGKNWTANGADIALSLLADEYQILPATLNLKLTYTLGTQPYEKTATLTYNPTTHKYSTYTFTDLPVLDQNGDPILYTVTDTATGYSFMIPGTVDEIALSTDSVTVKALTNDYEAGQITVTKFWKETLNGTDVTGTAFGRDDAAEPIQIQLYRDGEKIGSPVTLSAANSWKTTFQGLPVYQNEKGDSGELVKSVYSVKEVGETGLVYQIDDTAYSVTYSDNVTLSKGGNANLSVTNTHEIESGSLTVTKNWLDSSNSFGTQPTTIQFTLEYSTDGTNFATVPATLTAPAFTTSLNPWTGVMADGATHTWEDLPVNYQETAIHYRVKETVVSGYNNGQSITSTPITLSYDSVSKVFGAETGVTNNLDTTSLTIKKTWTNTEYLTPVSSLFVLEYRHGSSGSWVTVSGNYPVAASVVSELTTTGELTIQNLPVTDGAGNQYEYRVREISTTVKNGGEPFTVDVAGAFSTGTDQTEFHGNGSIYEAHAVTFKNTDGTFTSNVSNAPVTGSLKVNKIWDDDKNRDGGRQTITIELYRDGEKFAETTLGITDSESYTFTDLPVYKDDSDGDDYSVYSVKEVGETNGSYTGDKQVVYAVTYSDAVTFASSDSISATVTNKENAYKGSYSVTKRWNDRDNAFGTRNPEITLTLEYSTDGQNWSAVPKYSNATKNGVSYTTSEPVCTDEFADGDSYTWNGLPVNYNGTAILYRVTESAIAGYNGSAAVSTEAKPLTTGVTTSGYLASDEITNSMDLTSLTLNKTWIKDPLEKVTPVSAEFIVEYRHGASTAWTPIPESYYGTGNQSAVLLPSGWSGSISDLPVEDAYGNSYEYRAKEIAVTIVGDPNPIRIPVSGSFNLNGAGTQYTGTGSLFASSVSISKESNSVFTVTAANTPVLGTITVKKVWNDDKNRDDGRQAIDLYLYRDGEYYATGHLDETTADSDGNWVCTFSDLPIYQNTSDGDDRSVYYVKEAVEQNGRFDGKDEAPYVVAYSESVQIAADTKKAETSLTNTHEIYKGSLTLTKIWNDFGNLYLSRPATVTLTLQYSLNGTDGWTDVVKDAEDSDAFTSSVNSWTGVLGNNETHTFEGLPVNANGAPIYYRVVESAVPGYNQDSAVISDAVTLYTDTKLEFGAAAKITNTLDTTSLTINKSWGNVDYETPKAANFKIEYRHGNSDWTVLSGAYSLETSSASGLTVTNLPKTDGQGNVYEYRVSEISIVYAVPGSDTRETADASGSFSQNGNGANWSGKAGIYAGIASVIRNNDGTYTANVTNTPVPGKLTVHKKWVDDSNRDAGRQAITIELYRDGKLFATETISAANASDANTWSYTFENLPVYRDNSDGDDLSVYYVRETGELNGAYSGKNGIPYIVAYSDVNGVTLDTEETASTKITNTHEIFTADLTVTKLWDDFTNLYQSRPNAITLTLQYSLNGADGWTDVVKDAVSSDAFTSSVNGWTGMLGHNETHTFEDLPVYANGNPIYYRVKESVVSGYNAGNTVISEATTLLTSDAFVFEADVEIENTLDTTSLTIQKAWDVVDYLAPVSATFRVEYRHGASEWTALDGLYTVDIAETGGRTIQDLPKADGKGNLYEYRVSEISVAYEDAHGTTRTVNASGIFSENGMGAEWQCYVSIYKGTVTVKRNEDSTYTATAVNVPVTSSLTVTKEWIDDRNRDSGRQTITIELYRDGVLFATESLDASSSAGNDLWSFTFEDLPVFADLSDGDDFSHYYIHEAGEQGGSYSGLRDVPYTVSYTKANGFSLVADETGSAGVINSHENYTGALTVTKYWNDYDNLYTSRPGSVTLTLQYSLNGTDGWTDVIKDALSSDAYTTSDNSWTGMLTSGQTYTFDGLPVNADGEPIYYRVMESPVSGYNGNEAVFTEPVTLETPMLYEFGAAVNLTNTLNTTSLTIRKEWDEVSYLTPVSASYQVEYRHGNSGWNILDGLYTVEVSAGSGLTIRDLPDVDGYGNLYEYRVSEVSIAYSGREGNVTVEASGSFSDNGTGGVWDGSVSIYHSSASVERQTDGTHLATSRNSPFVGSLKVIKEWNDGENRDLGRQPVTVELYRDGTLFSTVTLDEDDQSARNIWEYTFTNLPVFRDDSDGASYSNYSVHEYSEVNGQYRGRYDVPYSVSYSDAAGLTLSAAEFAETHIINTHEIYRGTLTVSKTVAGNDYDPEQVFRFVIKLDEDFTFMLGTTSFSGGLAEFQLKGGESIEFNGIPNGCSYTIEEADYSADGYVTASVGATGTIDHLSAKSAGFTNTKDTFGSVSVTKRISGNMARADKAFDFVITLDDAEISGTYGDMAFENGVASFTLVADETKTASGLPNGISYSILEADYSEEGYTTEYVGNTGTIAGNTDASCIVTNTKDIPHYVTITKTSTGLPAAFNYPGPRLSLVDENGVTVWSAELVPNVESSGMIMLDPGTYTVVEEVDAIPDYSCMMSVFNNGINSRRTFTLEENARIEIIVANTYKVTVNNLPPFYFDPTPIPRSELELMDKDELLLYGLDENLIPLDRPESPQTSDIQRLVPISMFVSSLGLGMLIILGRKKKKHVN